MKRFLTRDDVKRIQSILPPEARMTSDVLDGHSVIIVHLTDEMLNAALHSAEAMHIIAKAKGLSEWIASTTEQRKAGMMGQIAVALYLYGEWSMAFKHAKLGEADDGDIQLGHFKINVITNAKVFTGSYDNLAVIDCKRYERNPFPLYIACSKLDDKIIIWGYARWDEVPLWHRGCLGENPESYQKPHKELHEIEELRVIFKVHLKPT